MYKWISRVGWALGTLVLMVSGPALAECSLSGNIEAEMTTDPDLPGYMYTMTIDWDMGSVHGLSHLDLVMDMLGGTCSCSDFSNTISVGEIAGTSDGENGCTVNYTAEIECHGDPSIPGVEGILLKFEPMEEEGCEPGPIGHGSFVFYSDLAPVDIDQEFVALVDKGGQESCMGTIDGVFPGMACDPVADDSINLGGLKSLFR